MWLGLVHVYVIFIILAVWFGLVRFLRCKPQTKLNCAVQCKSHLNSSKPSAVFCGFGLDWFGLRFFYWVGSVLNTPNSTHHQFKYALVTLRNWFAFVYFRWGLSLFLSSTCLILCFSKCGYLVNQHAKTQLLFSL